MCGIDLVLGVNNSASDHALSGSAAINRSREDSPANQALELTEKTTEHKKEDNEGNYPYFGNSCRTHLCITCRRLSELILEEA